MIDIIFYAFAGLAVVFALIVLFTKNILYAAFALVGTFLCIAAVYVLAQAEFLAIAQLMIYVGGILVLLIFGVMLTNKVREGVLLTSAHNKVIGAIVCVSLFAILVYGILRMNLSAVETTTYTENNVNQLGEGLMSSYLLPFEIAGVILLVALVGAATISGYKSKVDEH